MELTGTSASLYRSIIYYSRLLSSSCVCRNKLNQKRNTLSTSLTWKQVLPCVVLRLVCRTPNQIQNLILLHHLPPCQLTHWHPQYWVHHRHHHSIWFQLLQEPEVHDSFASLQYHLSLANHHHQKQATRKKKIYTHNICKLIYLLLQNIYKLICIC